MCVPLAGQLKSHLWVAFTLSELSEKNYTSSMKYSFDWRATISSASSSGTIGLGYPCLTLPAPTCSCNSLDYGPRPLYPLMLCRPPGNAGFSFTGAGWGGLQQSHG